MKTFTQLMEDLQKRRLQLAKRQRENLTSFKERVASRQSSFKDKIKKRREKMREREEMKKEIKKELDDSK